MSTSSPTHDGVPHVFDANGAKHERPTFTNPDPTNSRGLNPTDLPQGTVQPFRFFDLPAEIRGMILGHVLEFERPLVQESPHSGDRKPLIDIKVLATIRPKPLIDIRVLATNHRMHDEAVQIFYGRNIFTLYLYALALDGLPIWIAHPEHPIRHLRRVRIIVSDSWIRWYQKDPGYQRHQALTDEMTRVLALCQNIQLMEIVFTYLSQAEFAGVRSRGIGAPPTSGSIKGLLNLLSGVSGKRAVYKQVIGSEKRRKEIHEKPAGYWTNLALSAEVVDIDGLSVE